MRKFIALREDLIKHLAVGIILALGFQVLGQEYGFSLVTRLLAIPFIVGAIAYLEEVRQAFTADRTPAHDDALITIAGGCIGQTLYGLATYA